jgi:hypothetical protein
VKELREAIAAIESDTSPTVARADVLKALHAIEENVAALRAAILVAVQASRAGGPDIEHAISSINAGNPGQPGLSKAATSKLWNIVHGLEQPISQSD